MSTTQITSGALASGAVELTNCSWYSPDDVNDTGAIKLPRGNTDERPTVAVGGREKLVIDLTVSNPDIEHSDPAFNMHDPWIWTWTGNYNRNTMVSETVNAGGSPTGLSLIRGSTYVFRNHTVGHSLWLKSQALTEAEFNAGTIDLYKLTTTDGVTNNGAKRTVGSEDPGIVTWTVPEDYAGDTVTIQHMQFGMNNTIPIIDPPARETLGYMRLNTDLGHDPNTNTGVEVYTGNGWKTIPFEDNVQAVQEHPTDDLTLDDNGLVTGSVTSTSDSGSITEGSPTVDDFGGLLLLAFLSDGKLSVDGNAVVVHDGSTPGGFAMLRADNANTPDDLVNKRFSFFHAADQTLTDTNIAGSSTARIAFTAVESGISSFATADSGKQMVVTKDVSASYFKFDMKIKPNTGCDIELWKNGSKISNADFTAIANYHNHFMWMEPAAFNDVFELRIYDGNSSVSINKTDLIVEFIGS